MGVKVASPINNEQISLENNDLKFIGTSTDGLNSNCRVSVMLNDVKPYQDVSATGPGGKGDYSLWSFLLTPDYNSTIREGTNKLTAKLSCENPDAVASDLATHYNVFFRGVSSMPTNTAISSSSTNNLQPSITTSTIPSTVNENSSRISVLSPPSYNNRSSNENSKTTSTAITTSTPASIDTPIIPKSLSIKITSHTQNQTVPTNIPLKISGISSDDAISNCTVYADWNDQKPLQRTTPVGPNGANDYSNWTFTYTTRYHVVNEGSNELTSKLDCGTDLVKYYTVNVTGIGEQQGQTVEASADETATSTNIDSPSQFNAPNSESPFPSNGANEPGNDSDNDGLDTDISGNDEVIQEDENPEQNIENNNDFFEDDDESESPDEELRELFE
jgi:hypothetical protein